LGEGLGKKIGQRDEEGEADQGGEEERFIKEAEEKPLNHEEEKDEEDP
jgi:hypothetical protein